MLTLQFIQFICFAFLLCAVIALEHCHFEVLLNARVRSSPYFGIDNLTNHFLVRICSIPKLGIHLLLNVFLLQRSKDQWLSSWLLWLWTIRIGCKLLVFDSRDVFAWFVCSLDLCVLMLILPKLLVYYFYMLTLKHFPSKRFFFLDVIPVAGLLCVINRVMLFSKNWFVVSLDFVF